MQELIETVFAHSENWGKVWFGMLFWGSVIGAGLLALFPMLSPVVVYAGAASVGATIGLIGRARGNWV
ncbi:MAG: hypothetical protein VCC00_05325 [Deltaproteobacteria bacterium]